MGRSSQLDSFVRIRGTKSFCPQAYPCQRPRYASKLHLMHEHPSRTVKGSSSAGRYVHDCSRRQRKLRDGATVVQIPLFPLTNASPYDRLSCPLTYSSVFSRAMFM